MQVCLHVEAGSEIELCGGPGLRRARRRRALSAPITVPIAATIGALVALVEAVAVFAESATINRRVAKIAVSVEIRSPAARSIMAARFKAIVKTTLRETFVRGCIRSGIVRPIVLGASDERQGNCQSS